jgi:hypothetical protein
MINMPLILKTTAYPAISMAIKTGTFFARIIFLI